MATVSGLGAPLGAARLWELIQPAKPLKGQTCDLLCPFQADWQESRSVQTFIPAQSMNANGGEPPPGPTYLPACTGLRWWPLVPLLSALPLPVRVSLPAGQSRSPVWTRTRKSKSLSSKQIQVEQRSYRHRNRGRSLLWCVKDFQQHLKVSDIYININIYIL